MGIVGGIYGGFKEQDDEITKQVANQAKHAATKVSNISNYGAGNPIHWAGTGVMRTMTNEFRDLPVMGGIATIAATAASIDRMRHMPNTSKGNIAGNSKFQQGYSGYYYATKRIMPEFAKIIDDYFSMYGYEVDSVKIPEIFSRQSWNFVKCANSDNRGNAPMEFISLINDIFNSGITFWHTWNIGDYSLNNDIVPVI